MTKRIYRAPIAAAILTLGVAQTASAATATDVFSSLWILGDSLSDNGNLFAATGDTVPASPPYFDGRFSNGPVWAEGLLDEFDAAGLTAANLAFGGATAVTNADLIPDLFAQADQVGDTPAFFLGDNPLVSVWFGANDLFDAIGAPDQLDLAEAAANEVADRIFGLSDGDPVFDDFILFNLPDLGATPRYSLLEPSNAANATAATNRFNEILEGRIGSLEAAGVNIYFVDIAAIDATIRANPATFGLDPTQVLLPCVFPDAFTAGLFGQNEVCDPATANERPFFDPVHPNAVLHQEFEAAARAAVAPAVVPLPASLVLFLTALGGLGVAAARRR